MMECYNIDHVGEMMKRGYRDPEDPRNLFADMYGAVYKRDDQPFDFRSVCPSFSDINGSGNWRLNLNIYCFTVISQPRNSNI